MRRVDGEERTAWSWPFEQSRSSFATIAGQSRLRHGDWLLSLKERHDDDDDDNDNDDDNDDDDNDDDDEDDDYDDDYDDDGGGERVMRKNLGSSGTTKQHYPTIHPNSYPLPLSSIISHATLISGVIKCDYVTPSVHMFFLQYLNAFSNVVVLYSHKCWKTAPELIEKKKENMYKNGYIV
ncbi:hypothetical protein M0802_004925 [Mischocyttarus mexicanus]|nr:hypothetical protein M0802_004925 [Mischocyttarus mexicanus]